MKYTAHYYGRVIPGGYSYVVKLEGPKCYVWGEIDGRWVEDDYFHRARFDTTYYDEITEAQAQEVIESYK